MAPRPYSDKSSLPLDSSNNVLPEIPNQSLPETPSPSTLSETTTPSPTPHELILIEPLVDTIVIQETNGMPDLEAPSPCYPTPGDIMPYDHSLPDFIRQITNQSNLTNLHSLSLRVISTIISLHRMSSYLPNLKELDLEGSILNSLRDIGCNFKKLQILKVGRCQLESLDGTFGLSGLRELYAQKNFINDVSPCSNLPHIRHIDVSRNRIRDISYAGFLSICKKLKSIVFTGNPATEVSEYRKHVRRILPQIETLDGVPFIDEENTDEFKESQMSQSYCEGSDSSSTGVPDSLSVSSSDSTNNLFEPEEDLFHLDKKNKQAKNLASQDQTDSVDNEVQKVLSNIKANLQLQEDFQNLNLNQSKVQKGYLEQAKMIEKKNANLKQKCVSIQKLDKDIENRTKKSNLLLNVNLNEELILTSEFSKCLLLEESKFCSPSTSASAANANDLRKSQTAEKQSGKPSTMYELTYHVSDDRETMKKEEIKFGTVKKRSSSSNSKSIIPGEKKSVDHNWGPSSLTTGLPICGNLTAALRTRKKIQSTREEVQNYLFKKFETKRISEEDESKKQETPIDGSGDYFDANEEDLIEEDVLNTSKKWRETFRRFRSNNGLRWKEEDECDHANLPTKETFNLDTDKN